LDSGTGELLAIWPPVRMGSQREGRATGAASTYLGFAKNATRNCVLTGWGLAVPFLWRLEATKWRCEAIRLVYRTTRKEVAWVSSVILLTAPLLFFRVTLKTERERDRRLRAFSISNARIHTCAYGKKAHAQR
jgi:hypothetical protein